MVWTQPLPNTIPIRIYKNTDNTISFTPNSTNKEFYFSPLYFFKEIPENWKNSDGFCIPNSSENSLQSLRQCISSYSNKEQPTILTVLENNKKMKKNFLLFFTIFLLFIFFLIIIINKFWFRK
jgi:hypothetical protein